MPPRRVSVSPTVWLTLACVGAGAAMWLTLPNDPPPSSGRRADAPPPAPDAGTPAPPILMQLAALPTGEIGAPRWARDGRHLSYEAHDVAVNTHETWILTLASDGHPARDPAPAVTVADGGAARLLGGAPPLAFDLAWGPAVRPTRQSFVVTSRSPNRSTDLYLDGRWLTSGAGNDEQPDWSPDGRRIAFTSQQHDSADLFVVDVAGSAAPRRLTSWPEASEMQPRWAPLGPALLFVRFTAGEQARDIGVIDDTDRPEATVRMLTAWPGDETLPSWSPDASRVAFYANRDSTPGTTFDLWVMPVEGGRPKKLERDVVVGPASGPPWSPDGRALFYVKRTADGRNPVMWVRPDGRARGVVETGTRLNEDLAVHGVGARIRLAFTSPGELDAEDEARRALYLVAFDLGVPDGVGRTRRPR